MALAVNAAWPELSVAVPSALVPSLKVTVPVGVPAPGEVAMTLAVNVTGLSKYCGLADELTVVVVLAWLTVCAKFAELLWLKLPSPLYVALIVWLPRLSELVLNVACPEALMVIGARLTPSTVNVIVPVRVPAPGDTGLTVAVKVTDWPNTDGFAEELTAVVVSALLTVSVNAAEVLVLKLVLPL